MAPSGPAGVRSRPVPVPGMASRGTADRLAKWAKKPRYGTYSPKGTRWTFSNRATRPRPVPRPRSRCGRRSRHRSRSPRPPRWCGGSGQPREDRPPRASRPGAGRATPRPRATAPAGPAAGSLPGGGLADSGLPAPRPGRSGTCGSPGPRRLARPPRWSPPHRRSAVGRGVAPRAHAPPPPPAPRAPAPGTEPGHRSRHAGGRQRSRSARAKARARRAVARPPRTTDRPARPARPRRARPAAASSSGPPRRATPSSGPSAWPRNTPPMGRPPTGQMHAQRLDQGQGGREGQGPGRHRSRGTARQPTATKRRFDDHQHHAPARLKARAHAEPGPEAPQSGHPAGPDPGPRRSPPRRHQSSPAAGKASAHHPQGGRDRASPTPAAAREPPGRGHGVTADPPAERATASTGGRRRSSPGRRDRRRGHAGAGPAAPPSAGRQRGQHPAGGVPPAADAGRDAHPAEGGAGHAQAGQGATAFSIGPLGPGGPLYWGKAAGPPGHPGSAGGPAPRGGAQLAEDPGHQVGVAEGGCRSSPNRPTEARSSSSPGRAGAATCAEVGAPR